MNELEQYKVYLHNITKVNDDGKSIPIVPAQTREFSVLEEAQKFAAEKKDEFDRIVIMRTSENELKMMKRFNDGEYVVSEEEKSI